MITHTETDPASGLSVTVVYDFNIRTNEDRLGIGYDRAPFIELKAIRRGWADPIVLISERYLREIAIMKLMQHVRSIPQRLEDSRLWC